MEGQTTSIPKKQAEIDVLSKVVNELGEVFVGLADKLSPILNEATSQPKEEVAEHSPLPVLIEEIRSNRFRVESVVKRMKDVSDRIEI